MLTVQHLISAIIFNADGIAQNGAHISKIINY